MLARPRADVRRPKPYQLCLEPLEARQLLSGAAPTQASPPTDSQNNSPALSSSPSQDTSSSQSNPGAGTDQGGAGSSGQSGDAASSAAASQGGNQGSNQAAGYSTNPNQSSASGPASKSTATTTQTSSQQQQQQPQQSATAAAAAKPATAATTSGDSQSQGSDGDPQTNSLSSLMSLVTSNGKPYGMDSATQPLRSSAVLVLFPADLSFGRPAASQGPPACDAGQNQLLSNGSSPLPPGGMAALQTAVAAAQAQASQRELQVIRAGAGAATTEQPTQFQARPQDSTFEQYLGGPDSLLHYSAALQPELLPQGGTVDAGLLSADLPTIGRAVDRFFAQLEGLADDLNGDFSALQLGLWLAAASGAVAGLELVRRRGRPVPGLPGSYGWEQGGFPQG